ncbi:MAG: hypothetical protein OXT67_00455, partial [Zetaproteobacteria bacterium]|nr:hypothetical protein [Zetaproteobacteria bacterium]
LLYILPTVAFFSLHPYRGSIYFILLLAPIYSLVWTFWIPLHQKYAFLFVRAVRLQSWVLLGIPMLVTLIAALNPEFAQVVTVTSQVALWVSVFLFIFCSYLAFQGSGWIRSNVFALGWSSVLMAFSVLLVDLGAQDMAELRKNLVKLPQGHVIKYWNLNRHTWTEWGAMNLWLGTKFEGIHNSRQLLASLQGEHTLLVPHEAALMELNRYIPDGGVLSAFDLIPIKRWSTSSDSIRKEKNILRALVAGKDLDFVYKYQFLLVPKNLNQQLSPPKSSDKSTAQLFSQASP